MKQKKQLTVKQQQKRYRTLQYSCFAGEIVSILTPYITLGIVYWDEWVQTSTDGLKMGLGGTLGLALLGITMYLFTKRKEKEKTSITDGWITFIVGYAAWAFIFLLLQNVMQQISFIMFCGLLGLLGAFGLDIESKNLKKKADTLKEIIGTVEKDTFKEKYEQELAKEKEENNSQPTE